MHMVACNSNRWFPFLMALLCTMAGTCLQGQDANPDTLFATAKQFMSDGQRDSALHYAELALELTPPESEQAGVIEWFIGSSLARRWKYDQAFPHLTRAIDWLEGTKEYKFELGDSYLKAGNCKREPSLRIAFYEQALKYFRAIDDSLSIAATSLDLGIVHYREGNLEQHRKLSFEGLDYLAGTSGGENLRVRLDFSLGRYYNAIGNHEAAIFYMGRAYTMLLENRPGDPILFNIGREYGLLLNQDGQYDLAMEVLASPILPDTVEKSQHRLYAEADIWLDMGRISMEAGAPNSAESCYQKALSSIKPYYGDQHVFTAYPYSELAGYYYKIGDIETSHRFRDLAMNIMEAEKVYKHPDYAKMSHNMSQVLEQHGDYDAMYERIDAGLEAISYYVDDPKRLDEIYRYDLVAKLLSRKSEMLALHPHPAISTEGHYAAHIDFLDSIQNRKLDPATRMEILEANYHVFDKAIALAFENYVTVGDPAYLEYALITSEKSKDQLYAQFLLQNRLRNSPAIDPGLIAEEERLNSELTRLELEIFRAQQVDSALMDQLERERTAVNVAVIELQHQLNDPYAKEGLETVGSPVEHVRRLGQSFAAIEFFQGDSYDYAFVVTGNSLDAVRLDKDTPLDDYIAALQNPRETATWIDLSTAVYTKLQPLVEGLPAEIEHLIIIPDGKWAQVPFESLLMTTPSSATDLPVLLKKYSVSYANSLRSFEIEASQEPAPRRLAAFAPEYDVQLALDQDSSGSDLYANLVRSGEYELPGAKREAKSITKIFGGRTYIADRASEAEFRENAHKYQVLHLSMHALLEDENPNFSRLLFTRTEDPVHDNFLYASELSVLPLRAEMAVLSACNTGRGKDVKGEGVMSLSRSFQYAGVPSVIHSLWKVPDDATADIMTNFYGELKVGRDKAQALRNAKLQYLDEVVVPETAHPYFWAGFVATGDVSSLQPAQSRWGHYVLLISVALAVVIGVSLRRLRLRNAQ